MLSCVGHVEHGRLFMTPWQGASEGETWWLMFPLQGNNPEITGGNPGADFPCWEMLCSLQVETALVTAEVLCRGRACLDRAWHHVAEGRSCGSASASSNQRHWVLRCCCSLQTCRRYGVHTPFCSFSTETVGLLPQEGSCVFFRRKQLPSLSYLSHISNQFVCIWFKLPFEVYNPVCFGRNFQ